MIGAPPIIALVYSDAALAADVMRHLAASLADDGASCCGVVQHTEPRPDRARCDVVLEDLTSGERSRLTEDRGPGARGCRLDMTELAGAVERARAALAADADVLIVNKFGKAEAAGGGFRSVIGDAVALGRPVLIAVPCGNLDSWRAFCGDLAIELSAEAMIGAGASVLQRLGLVADGRDRHVRAAHTTSEISQRSLPP